MSKLAKWRIPWLAGGLAGLLLLASCASVISGEDAPSAGVSGASTAGAGEVTAEVSPTMIPAETAVAEPSGTPVPTAPIQRAEQEYEIVTLLPPDAIRAIDDPAFYDVIGADLEYEPEELVLGVELAGEAKAYSIGLLAQREIVNDTVGGQPIAVTY